MGRRWRGWGLEVGEVGRGDGGGRIGWMCVCVCYNLQGCLAGAAVAGLLLVAFTGAVGGGFRW